MKYCKKCGVEISENAQFCANCGEKLDNVNEVFDVDDAMIKGNIKSRSIALAIVLSIVTCGIYSIYWMIKLNDEALALAGEKGPSGIVVFLLNLITFGIYGYVWAYKMGNCSDEIRGSWNGGNNGILYLILAVLGLNIVDMALLQGDINNKVN